MTTLLKSSSRFAAKSKKIEANRYLPALARGLVTGEFTLEQAARYFTHFAALYSIGIDTNAICNLSCNYCYLDHYNRTTAPEYIDLARLSDVLTRHCEEAENLDLIALVGKEPFADGRGVALLRHIEALSVGGTRFRFGVVTNGVLVDRYLDDIPSSISYIDVSLDGPESITDRVRGKVVFGAATRNIRRLVDRGFEVWISAVLHVESVTAQDLEQFMAYVAEDLGCTRFYFSPIRNFTGSLQERLLSFRQIAAVQDDIVAAVERLRSIERVILDHPYEAVWRDYFWNDKDAPERLARLRIDAFGNILDPLTPRAYRKLDVFPHGPWGTCRIDATGNYLWDVESRTYAHPDAVGTVKSHTLEELHGRALNSSLIPMLERFMKNVRGNRWLSEDGVALTTVSLPML
jgi:MoaA/NifB/PqqE/SkfB family radical SAM enzyme